MLVPSAALKRGLNEEKGERGAHEMRRWGIHNIAAL
jgi:hypothetical protein